VLTRCGTLQPIDYSRSRAAATAEWTDFRSSSRSSTTSTCTLKNPSLVRGFSFVLVLIAFSVKEQLGMAYMDMILLLMLHGDDFPPVRQMIPLRRQVIFGEINPAN